MKKTSVAALAVVLVASTAVTALSKSWATNSRKGPIVTPFCCSQYALKPVPLKFLESYHYSPSSCSLQAVIFITIRGRRICADPNAEWTKDRIHNLK